MNPIHSIIVYPIHIIINKQNTRIISLHLHSSNYISSRRMQQRHRHRALPTWGRFFCPSVILDLWQLSRCVACRISAAISWEGEGVRLTFEGSQIHSTSESRIMSPRNISINTFLNTPDSWISSPLRVMNHESQIMKHELLDMNHLSESLPYYARNESEARVMNYSISNPKEDVLAYALYHPTKFQPIQPSHLWVY